MKINLLLYSFGLSGGNRAAVEIASRMDHDVTVVSPATPCDAAYPEVRDRPWTMTMVNRFRRLFFDRLDWYDIDSSMVKHFDYRKSASLPDADVTIATEWKTAHFAVEQIETPIVHLVQHYEVWPMWEDESCWAEALHRGGSTEMVEVEPDDLTARAWKKRFDDVCRHSRSDVVTTSDWLRECLEKFDVSIVDQVDYGINREYFDDLGFGTERVVMGMYRGSTWRGDREILASFRALKRAYPSVKFVLVGRTPGYEIPDSIEHVRDPPPEELKKVYSLADVFVYPSWAEGYGMPPMEAMASRTALVSTPVGAVPQYAHPDGVEWVQFRRADQIVDSVSTVLDDPDKMFEMQIQNYEESTSFEWDDAARTMEGVIS